MEGMNSSGARRILLLNRNHIGDALFTLPAITVLRAALPDAWIVNVAPASAGPWFDDHPALSEHHLRPIGVAANAAWLARVRRARFDTVISFSFSSHLWSGAAWASGAPRRIGFQHHGAVHALFNHRAPLREDRPYVDDMLDLARLAAPLPPGPAPLKVRIRPEWIAESERGFASIPSLAAASDPPWVGLNPGATREIKQWPEDRWAALSDRLTEAGWQPILFGGPEDREKGGRIQAHCHSALPSLVGQLSLGGLAAAFTRCAVLVSADSGPLHVAVAADTPVVGLYGPTDPRRTGPYTSRAVVLHHPNPSAEGGGRMDAILVEDVLEAVETFQSPHSITER